jgi:hypothetical protein
MIYYILSRRILSNPQPIALPVMVYNFPEAAAGIDLVKFGSVDRAL